MQHAFARTPATVEAPAVVSLRGIGVEVDGAARPLLRGVDWRVQEGEHWAVIGANGAGKTTLLLLIRGALEPTSGELSVLGGRPGTGGLRDPGLRIGAIDGQPRSFAGHLTAFEVVTLQSAGPAAMLGARVTDEQRRAAHELLRLFGCAHLADRRYASCSQGERQRVLLARVLMRDPDLVLYDEPITGLDLPSREALLQAMTRLAADRPHLATVTVTHHLEELAPSTTHALLLRDGEVIAAGPVDETVDEETVSACFGVPVRLTRAGERWAARAVVPGW